MVSSCALALGMHDTNAHHAVVSSASLSCARVATQLDSRRFAFQVGRFARPCRSTRPTLTLKHQVHMYVDVGTRAVTDISVTGAHIGISADMPSDRPIFRPIPITDIPIVKRPIYYITFLSRIRQLHCIAAPQGMQFTQRMAILIDRGKLA